MKEFRSVFESPEDLFQDAEKKGIIHRSSAGQKVKIDGVICDKVQIQILHPDKWVNFLVVVQNNTKNPSEFEFVNNLLKEFEHILKNVGQQIQQENMITDEKIQKLKEINTIDELLKSFKSGEL